MKNLFVLSLIVFIASGKLFSQAPTPEWTTDLDYSKSVFTGEYRTLVDASGNIFSMVLSGPIDYGPFDRVTIKKFDPAGILLWSKIFIDETDFLYHANQGDLTLDADGNPIVMYESTSNNIVIVKFNTDGDQLWSYTYPGACGSYAYRIKTDALGNVFCCGGMYECTGNSKLLSLKLNASGGVLWSKFYDPENSVHAGDGGYALDVDQSGNLFVGGTGYHSTTGIGNNVIILKYNSAGVFQWVYEYNGESSSTSEQIRDVVADNTGGCYAVGEINTIVGGQDIGAFKINSSGGLLWLYHKNGSANGFDNGNAIKLTSGGEPVISCGISTSTNGYAWFLSKLNSSTGNETWSKQYNGPDGNNDYGGTELQIDENDNCFQFGYTYSFATASDMVYLKYDSNGISKDTVAYSSGGNSADVFIDGTIDASGNIYLGGYTDVSISIPFANARLIKYDASGVQQWINIFSAPGYAEENVTAPVADEYGHLYIAGTYDDTTNVRHLRVIALNNDGSVKWKNDFKGNGFLDPNALITLDHEGNIVVASAELIGSYNILLVKFDTAGHVIWNKDFNLTDDYDYPTDVTVDHDNNICVACTGFRNSSNSNNIFTLKCNGSDGAQQWLDQYEGGHEDVSVGIAVDSSGNVFVNGSSSTSVKNRMITIKYSPAGIMQWTSFVTNDVYDAAESMVLTKDNNIITGGYGNKSSGDRNLRIVKYDNATGQVLFNATYDHLNKHQYDFLAQMASDDSSNIYCTGSSSVDADSVLTLKLSSSGILQWTRSFALTPDIQFASLGYDIRFDGKQNVFVAAQSSNRVTLLNYTTSGELQWVYATPDTLYPLIIHHRYIALNDKGGVYLAYTSFDSITYKNYRAVKFCNFSAPEIIADGPTTFCKGAFVILNAGDDGQSNYQWLKNATDIPGATQVIYKVKKTGNYQVSVSNGVCNAISDTAAVMVNPLPPATVTPSGTVNICLGDTILLHANNGNNNTYQWLKNNQPINGATANTFAAFNTGKYGVTVTKNSTGCSKTSVPTQVHITCKAGELLSLAPAVYPNPNDGKFTLDLSNVPDHATVIITDLLGKIVWEKLSDSVNDSVISVDLTHITSGLYYVIIKTGDKQWMEKVEITR